MGTPPEGSPRAVAEQLAVQFPAVRPLPSSVHSDKVFGADPGTAFALLEFLRDGSRPRYRLLADLTAYDTHPAEPRFVVVYHLLSLEGYDRIQVCVRLPGDSPAIASVVPLWPGADMLEREVFDLFGIHFTGHPGLSRLLMPEDWQGHPLRKDYAVEGER